VIKKTLAKEILLPIDHQERQNKEYIPGKEYEEKEKET
jgi:hypothetical protein